MYKCIICGSEKIKAAKTLVNNFVAQRMLGEKRVETMLLHCKSCGFAFYSLRPDDDAMARFYAGYRDEVYQAQRQVFDPWYSAQMNELIGKNNIEIENRRQNLTRILEAAINPGNIKKLLDYGGDKGQHIPACFAAAEKYVYDIGGATCIDGVSLIKDGAGLKAQRYDFIMCCHVLEHTSSPQAIVKEIKNLCAPGGYLYIELPFDSPFAREASFYSQFLKSGHFNLRFIVGRAIARLRWPRMMHEHINFFSQQSVERLLENNGFKIISAGINNLDFGWVRQDVISVLAKLP